MDKSEKIDCNKKMTESLKENNQNKPKTLKRYRETIRPPPGFEHVAVNNEPEWKKNDKNNKQK